MNKNYTHLRNNYTLFRYEAFEIEQKAEEIVLSWRFSIPGLAHFSPSTRIRTKNLQIINAPDSPLAQKMVFALGMCEAISYWKCACPPQLELLCGGLDDKDALWWKNLWYHGLGEFFYRNNITPDVKDFVSFKALSSSFYGNSVQSEPHKSKLRLVPVGGGKDSCVSLYLLRGEKLQNRLFTINDQIARTECARVSGYTQNDILQTYRRIDPELLRLNHEGFLNGHTPFSAITAFLSMYCAYLIGAKEIALSNESSANEPSVAGTDVNHQYSKSFAFESDFREYCSRSFGNCAEYYSLLRPFNELQIAAQFSELHRLHPVFRSCNSGSKTNSWCGKCGKCLFTFGMLSAFLQPYELEKIFGSNLFENSELLPEFEGLCGLKQVKPFECVGTVGEFSAAISMAMRQYPKEKQALLLRLFDEKIGRQDFASFLLERNEQHFVPHDRMPKIEEMFKYAASFSE